MRVDPARIKRDQAERIYDDLIQKYHLDQIPDPDIRAQTIDTMVNPGIGGAGSMLLDVLEEHGYDVRSDPTDNAIGPRARGVIKHLVEDGKYEILRRINNDLARKRQQYYEDRIAEDPAKEEFRRGWMDRARTFRFLPTGRQP